MFLKRFTAYTLMLTLSLPLLGCSGGDTASPSSDSQDADADLEAPSIELPGDDTGASDSSADDEGTSEG